MGNLTSTGVGSATGSVFFSAISGDGEVSATAFAVSVPFGGTEVASLIAGVGVGLAVVFAVVSVSGADSAFLASASGEISGAGFAPTLFSIPSRLPLTRAYNALIME